MSAVFTPGYEIPFGPHTAKPRSFDLLERLRETKDGYPQTGSGGIGSDGRGYIRMNPAPQFPVNPDGSQAAELIELLSNTLRSIHGVGSLTRQNIDDALTALAKARGQ